MTPELLSHSPKFNTMSDFNRVIAESQTQMPILEVQWITDTPLFAAFNYRQYCQPIRSQGNKAGDTFGYPIKGHQF
ncbi:hypothetical protein TNCV_690861 [Trichonephila clavipes]|nr:hypothetical protein TNCV_690861 [Trichonephila clavipes]